MAADANSSSPAPARSRIPLLVGALALVTGVYLCLPKSWFEVPEEAPVALRAGENAPGTSSAPPVPGSAPAPQNPEEMASAARQNPLDYAARSRYGMALATAGKGQEAEREFLAAIRLAPENPGVYHNLGIFYNTRKQYAQAEEMFNRELELAPGNGRTHYYRALTFQSRRMTDRAIAQFRLATQLAPEMPDPYLALAIELTRLQPVEKTQELVEKFRQLSGSHVLADYTLSGVYKTRQQYAEAEKYALKTIEAEPNNYIYQHNLGQIYYYARRFEDAERVLKHCLTLNPRKPSIVLSELGLNAQNAGKFPEAVGYFQKALEADPNEGAIRLDLSRTYLRMGDPESARREEAIYRKWEREQRRKDMERQQRIFRQSPPITPQ